MTYSEIIITALSGTIILINIISCALIIKNSNVFFKQDVILKLYTSPLFACIFVLLSAVAVWAALSFCGFAAVSLVLCSAIVSGAAHMVILQNAVCGITKEALHYGGKVIEWHTVYDFYIDKKRRTVIFSTNAKGGLTLKGLTKPLRYREEDEEKLEKFLDSHISKRFNKIVIR
jgi:hypothetical protein